MYQLSDFVMGDGWQARVGRLRPVCHGLDDEGERSTRNQHVVDGFSDVLLVGSVERLTESDQPIRSGRSCRQVLG